MDGKIKGPDGGCFCCSIQWSSQWRRGPTGEKNLCNKCGVAYYQNQFSWADPVHELMARRKMLLELKAEEERSALAAVAAALERENLEQDKLKEDQSMGLAENGVVTESRNEQQDNEQVVANDLLELENEGLSCMEPAVQTGGGVEALVVGQSAADGPRAGAEPPHGFAAEANGNVGAAENADHNGGIRSSELVSPNVVAPGAVVASRHDEVSNGPGPPHTGPGASGMQGGGKSLKQDSSAKRGQKRVVLDKEEKANAKEKNAAGMLKTSKTLPDEPARGEETAKPVRQAPRKMDAEVGEDKERGVFDGPEGWDKEGGSSEQAGFLPGLQEGVRCCKSNNRSWRCSRTRHPGSRYCIYHIRDYVDGKLVPRKNLPAHGKPHRLQSTEPETDVPDPNNRRRSTRQRGMQQETEDGVEHETGGQYADSEGSEGEGNVPEVCYSGDELDGDGEGGPPPLLPQQHLPMKKRFAMTPGADRERVANLGLGGPAGTSGEASARDAFEDGEHAFNDQRKELAERVIASTSNEEARIGRRESISDEGPNGAAAVTASHAPVRVTLGELPDAFLRAQERGMGNGDAHAEAGVREAPYRPESSMSPKGESLRRVGMIVEALAGGRDNFGLTEDGAAEAHEASVKKPGERLESEGKLAAGGVNVKAEDGEPKGEFKRCIMSGGTGWKCGRPRIEDSKYCQYHFELRRKQRQNSGARAAKGAGKRRAPGLKRTTREAPKGAPEAQPRGRRRKLAKVETGEAEQEPYPFLSLEFRLQKRTRTKKAVRPHSAVDRLLLAAKVRREDSLELLSEQAAGTQRLRCFQVKVSDLGEADFSEMDEDEAGAHEALTQMLAASTHQGPSGSDLLKKEDNGPERSTGACAELAKKDSTDEATATPASPKKPTHVSSPQASPGATMAARHALKRLVAAEGAGESDGAEPKRSRTEAHEARRLAWELRTAEEAQARLEAEGAKVAWKLKHELATRAQLEASLTELTRAEEVKEKPLVAALQEEVAALRHELGEERAVNGVLRKQVRQLNDQLAAQEAQFLGHQADLEVLEAKHKDLEANIGALLLEKHALQDELSLLRRSNKCMLCHTLTANTAVDPCGCRFCSSCLSLPTKSQSNGTKDRPPSLALQCPACRGTVRGAVKLLKPVLLEPVGCFRTG